VPPLREHYQPPTSAPELQPAQPVMHPAPIEENIPFFEEPVAAENPPGATPTSSDSTVTVTRNGVPEATVSKPQQKPPTEKSAAPTKEEVLKFEPATRGRFEKSEPTIIEGEDLDVPTYLRKHIKVK